MSKQVKKKAPSKPKKSGKKVVKPAKKSKPAPKAKKAVKNPAKPLSQAKPALKKQIKAAAKKITKKAAKAPVKAKTPVKAVNTLPIKNTSKAGQSVSPASKTLKKDNTEINKVPRPIVEKTQAEYVKKPLFNASQNNQQKTNAGDMKDEKLRYSEEELKEFEVLITDKLSQAKKELTYIKEALSRKNDPGTDTTAGTLKLLEDGADTAEKESFTQLAARQQKFIQQLENAQARIKNGTYGICVDTGKLIPKERLRAVPHTQHSIEAKLNRKD
jgi:DnaK suppressor protein